MNARASGGDALPVEVHAAGAPATTGTVTVEHPSRGRRLREAGLLALGGAMAAVLLLPVPLMHFVGLGLFVASIVVAVRRLWAPAVVRSARGTCPRCRAEGPFFVGFGRRRLQLPIGTSCSQCAWPLTLAHRARNRPA